MAEAAVADPKVEQKPVEPPKPAPTAEEIAAQVDDFKVSNALFDNPRMKTGWDIKEAPKVEPAPEPVAEEAPPVEEPAREPAPALESDAAPAVARETVVVKKPVAATDAPPTAEDEQARIDAAVDQRLRQAGIDPLTQRQPERQDAPPAPRNDADAQLFQVLDEMAKLNPDYEGLKARTQEFWQRETDYKRKWIKDNPEETFDAKAEEHSDFYEKHEPKMRKPDFDFAQRKIERDRIKAEVRDEVREEIAPELNEFRRERQMTKLQPVIAKAANEAAVAVLAGVPEFEKAMDDGKGNFVRSVEREKAMEASNPVLYALATEESDKTMATVAEIEKMDKLGAAYALDERKSIPLPNGETFRPHAEIVNTLDELEARYAASPDEQIVKGKQFITVAQRSAYIAQINQARMPEAERQNRLNHLRNSTWTVTAERIKAEVIAKSKQRIQSLAKRIPAAAPKPAETNAHRNGSNGKPADATKPTATTHRNGSSDTVTSGDVVVTRNPHAKNPEKISDVLFKW